VSDSRKSCSISGTDVILKHAWPLLVSMVLLPRILGAEEAPFVVRLFPEHQTVRPGKSPAFTVVVEARSHLRILRLDRRGDLNDNYAELRVTQDGKRVDTPVAISDPGPVDHKDDYVDLEPGQTITWAEDGLPKLLTELPRGTYTAVERVRADWNAPLVESNTVTFEVASE